MTMKGYSPLPPGEIRTKMTEETKAKTRMYSSLAELFGALARLAQIAIEEINKERVRRQVQTKERTH